MSEDKEWKWEEQVRHKCHCGHVELNEDKKENKFLVFDEKLHSSSSMFRDAETWTQMKCPKCNSIIVEEY